MSDAMGPICHINLAKGFRGGERQTELLIRGLAETGMLQTLVYRENSQLGARVGDVPGVECRSASGILSAVIASKGAVLIHAHEGRGVYVGYLRRLVSGTPYIVTRRVAKPPSHGLLTRMAYRRAASIVSISTAVADGMRMGYPNQDVVLIPSAVSDLTSDPSQTDALRQRYTGRFVVGHIGALDHATKGQMHLIRVAQRFSQSNPEIHFVFVGSGPDEEILKHAAMGLDNVCFTGFVDNVGDYLDCFDMFAFPSHTEGLGSILLDAMHFGLPVVATRVGGIPDIVQDGVNGLLIDGPTNTGDEVALDKNLARAIMTLYKEADTRARLTDQGRVTAQKYDPVHMVQKYKTVYDRLLTHKQEPGTRS